MILKYNHNNHGYWLDGKRCNGASTLASTIDNRFGLEQWFKRQVAVGVAQSDELIEEINATGQDDKKALDALAQRALDLAGSSLKADAGTAAHDLTERHDRGEKVKDDARGTLASWRVLLASAGLTIEDDLIERCIVHSERKICGRFDRMCRRAADGKLVTVDLKTGSIDFPHSMSIQLAIYANADFLSGQLEWTDEVRAQTEVFHPMPDDIDKDIGYIVHVPDDGEAAVYAIDIRRGWQITNDLVLPVVEWRKVKGEKLLKRVA